MRALHGSHYVKSIPNASNHDIILQTHITFFGGGDPRIHARRGRLHENTAVRFFRHDEEQTNGLHTRNRRFPRAQRLRRSCQQPRAHGPRAGWARSAWFARCNSSSPSPSRSVVPAGVCASAPARRQQLVVVEPDRRWCERQRPRRLANLGLLQSAVVCAYKCASFQRTPSHAAIRHTTRPMATSARATPRLSAR